MYCLMVFYSEGTTDFQLNVVEYFSFRLLVMSPTCSLSFVSSWLASEVTLLTSLSCIVVYLNIQLHVFPRELLLHIGYNILKNVIEVYNKILQILESTSSQQLQNCALQLLFDVKFLSNLLPHSSTLATQEV